MRSDGPAAPAAAIVMGAAGVALVACAVSAGQGWLDRHFLPDFFVSRQTLVQVELVVRLAIGAAGGLVALLARPLGRFVAADRVRSVAVLVAIAASLGTTEAVLRRVHLRAREEVTATKEPLRQRDAHLGWLFVPSRVGYQRSNGRLIRYAFDGHGYRVASLRAPVDPTRPALLFSGESMMVGEKLHWEETIPAQTGAILGLQSANIAVSGFATDQAYLRLRDELPRFPHPVAVVLLFTPSLFDRNLDDDRPHLGPGLRWLPAEERWRLTAMARRLVRYRTEAAIERGIAVTRDVLRATVALAQSRGARPLVVVPQFGEEEPRERMLRRRLLDEPGIPYVQVPLDPSWRVRDDGHPDPRAARRIAEAIAARLRE